MTQLEEIFKSELKMIGSWHYEPRSPTAIRLDLNESPLPPSPKVIKAALEASLSANRYPVEAEIELNARIAKYVNLDPANVVIGNGSDCLIHAIMDATIRPGDWVLMPSPSFQVFETATLKNGGHVKYVKLNPPGFKVSPDTLLREARGCKVLVIVNPNNPTGNLVMNRHEIEDVVSSFEGLVVVDEAYYEFSRVTVVDLVKDYENLVVLRTFSKAFCMAGFRIGYAVASERVTGFLKRARQEFPVSAPSLKAAIAALEDLEYVKYVVSLVEKERKRLYERLRQIEGIEPFPSCTNFILFKASRGDIASKLARRGIFIRDFSKALGRYYFRVTVGLPNENERFVEELRKILEEA